MAGPAALASFLGLLLGWPRVCLRPWWRRARAPSRRTPWRAQRRGAAAVVEGSHRRRRLSPRIARRRSRCRLLLRCLLQGKPHAARRCLQRRPLLQRSSWRRPARRALSAALRLARRCRGGRRVEVARRRCQLPLLRPAPRRRLQGFRLTRPRDREHQLLRGAHLEELAAHRARQAVDCRLRDLAGQHLRHHRWRKRWPYLKTLPGQRIPE